MLADLPYFNTATDVTDIDAAWDTWLQHYNTSVSECVPQCPKLDICRLKK